MSMIKTPQYDEILDFITSQAGADLFHHPIWINFLAECYGYTPHIIITKNKSAKINGYMPLLEVKSWLTGNRLIGLPFSDFCIPIVKDDSALTEIIQILEDMLKKKKWEYIKVHSSLPKIHPTLQNGEYFYRHTTKLTKDPIQVFSSFDKSQVQRSIRQAEKQNLKISFGQKWEDVKSYYSLHIQTRQRLGAPTQPLRFFRLLWERIISQNLGFVILALYEGKPVAGAVFLHFNQTLTYKFGASDTSFWKLRPNHLIFWRAIQWGCENGYKTFDWGRTDFADNGLREFKQRWGSEEQIIQYSIIGGRMRNKNRNPLNRIIQKVIQLSPTWVSRVIGELFYVHSA